MEDDEDEGDDPDGSGLRMLCFAGVLGVPVALAGILAPQCMKALTTKYGYEWPQYVHGSRFGDYPQTMISPTFAE